VPGTLYGTNWRGCQSTDSGANGYDVSCGSDETPYHEVTLDAFFIDITEVTAGDYAACVTAGDCTYTGPTTRAGRTYNNSRDTHPINGVDWQDAVDYCTWKGKSLPTDAQWEKAARGGCELHTTDCAAETSDYIYPWGDMAATCTYAVMDAGGTGCGTGSPAAVGSKSTIGDSPYGVQDMAGNVFEQTSDWFAHDFYCVGNGATGETTCSGTDAAHADAVTNPTGPTGPLSLRSLRGFCRKLA
jgi:formylglycine-generating enzyme required for sulfatase activity